MKKYEAVDGIAAGDESIMSFFLTCFPYITKDSRTYQVSQHSLRMACDGIL